MASAPRSKTWSNSETIKSTILVLSLFFNLWIFLSPYRLHRCEAYPAVTDDRSPFAALSRNLSVKWTHNDESLLSFSNESETSTLAVSADEDNTAWPAELELDPGGIALSIEYAQVQGLPPGHSFPWDRTKQIYVVSAYHSLHCLTTIRHILLAVMSPSDHEGVDMSESALQHALHCLSSLRQDVMCAADDTPRYAGFVQGKSGVGQFRQCRSWELLEQWARQHTACFRYEHGRKFWGRPDAIPYLTESEKTQNDGLWHYSWCPEDSEYYKVAKEQREKVFGVDSSL